MENVSVARTVSTVWVSAADTVKPPLELIVVPATVVFPHPHPSHKISQITPCGGLLVPATVAVKLCVPPLATLMAAGLTVTEVTVGISTVTVAVPLIEVSAIEVARTVSVARVSVGDTVRPPLELIVVPSCVPQIHPSSINHVTPCGGLLTPPTVAVKFSIPPLPTVAVAGLTVTQVAVGIVTLAVPITEVSDAEVARTVSAVRFSFVSTVRTPLSSIEVPQDVLSTIDQVTSCGGLLVPITEATKPRVPPRSTLAVAGLTVTDVTVGWITETVASPFIEVLNVDVARTVSVVRASVEDTVRPPLELIVVP